MNSAVFASAWTPVMLDPVQKQKMPCQQWRLNMDITRSTRYSVRDLVVPFPISVDDPPSRPPQEGIGLCLSGGGYRAMLFHVGTLWRLNDAKYLPKLARVSSVSGGSITAARLGQVWAELDFQGDVAQNFESQVVAPIRELAGKTIDVSAVARGILSPGSISDKVAAKYQRHLYDDATLQKFPADGEGPRFIVTAANLQSGALWRFSRPYAGDWKVGRIGNPTISIASAVAASSAFPPFLSPAVLKFDGSSYIPGSGEGLQHPPFTTRVVLSDGGVYDNLGLEPVWKRYKTVLVSDGGGKMEPEKDPARDWPRHMLKVLGVIDTQVRNLRKHQVIGSYLLPENDSQHRNGAYWGIRTDIANYDLPDALPCPHEKTMVLARIPTRLQRLPDSLQEQLINWGYAVCDAAMRKHVDRLLENPPAFPYPSSGVG